MEFADWFWALLHGKKSLYKSSKADMYFIPLQKVCLPSYLISFKSENWEIFTLQTDGLDLQCFELFMLYKYFSTKYFSNHHKTTNAHEPPDSSSPNACEAYLFIVRFNTTDLN